MRETIDVDSFVLKNFDPSETTEAPYSIDRLKKLRAELKEEFDKHQAGFRDPEYQDGTVELSPGLEQILEKWVPEGGR